MDADKVCVPRAMHVHRLLSDARVTWVLYYNIELLCFYPRFLLVVCLETAVIVIVVPSDTGARLLLNLHRPLAPGHQNNRQRNHYGHIGHQPGHRLGYGKHAHCCGAGGVS